MRPDERVCCARRALLTVLIAAVFGAACSEVPEDPRVKIEFDRHFREGLEQMRKYLPESARAELDWCARIRPDDPELLFQQARLKLFPAPNGPDTTGAIMLLSKAVKQRPDNVKAHRLLYEIEKKTGSAGKANQHAEAIRAVYGAFGALELETVDGGRFHEHLPTDGTEVLEGDARQFVRYYAESCFGGSDRNWVPYNPNAAVPGLQDLLDRYPDAAGLRLAFARQLLRCWVRVTYLDRPDLPLMSSKLIINVVQLHLAKVFDQLDPGSPDAIEALTWRCQAALRMGDWDEAIALAAVVNKLATSDDRRRESLGWMAIAQLRRGQAADSVRLLDESLEGDTSRFRKGLQHLWLLHLAQDQAGVPPESRRKDFTFRPDLDMNPSDSPLFFKDMAADYGINIRQGLGPAAWGDYDGDGKFDLFVSGLDSYGTLFHNDGDRFSDATRVVGLDKVKSGFSSTFSDYDNDGWPDLFVGRLGWGGPAPDSLFRNNGNGTFTDVTTRAGVDDHGSTFVHAWSDVDRDGNLDLYVANGITGCGDTNVLYHNNGNGTFSDVTEQAGLKEPSGTRTIGCAFGDYDRDGWPDLFVSGFKTTNRLYRNRGDGTFEEVAEKAGVADPDHVGPGYVAFFADLDNDGWLDILRTSEAQWPDGLYGLSAQWPTVPADSRARMLRQGSPRLYRNNHNGTFADVTDRAGLSWPLGVMGAGLADLDNDGYLDLYLGTGGPDMDWQEPDRFFHNNGDGTFTDLTFASGLGCIGKAHGTTFVDIDGDGQLEIYVQEGGFVMGDPFASVFYKNQKPTGNHWLHIDLEGTKSNRDATGAKLLVTTGKLTMLREVGNGEGFGSSDSRTVEFGLGHDAKADRLEIRWPSGLVQTFTAIPADQRIFVREGEEWIKWASQSHSFGPRHLSGGPR